MPGWLPRISGVLLVLGVILFLASLFLGNVASHPAAIALSLSLLLMIPEALAWAHMTSPDAATRAWAATGAGVLSVALWAAAGWVLTWSWEPVYISLSAVWWLGTGGSLRAHAPIPLSVAWAIWAGVALVRGRLTRAGSSRGTPA